MLNALCCPAADCSESALLGAPLQRKVNRHARRITGRLQPTLNREQPTALSFGGHNSVRADATSPCFVLSRRCTPSFGPACRFKLALRTGQRVHEPHGSQWVSTAPLFRILRQLTSIIISVTQCPACNALTEASRLPGQTILAAQHITFAVLVTVGQCSQSVTPVMCIILQVKPSFARHHRA